MDKTLYSLTISILVIIAMAIMVGICLGNPVLDKKLKGRYCLIFSLCALLALIDYGTYAMEATGNGNFVILDYICNFIGFTCNPLLPILLAGVISSNQKRTLNKIPYIIYGAYVITYAFLVGFGYAYHIDANCVYTRVAPGFILYLVFHALGIAYLLLRTIVLWYHMLSTHPIILLVLLVFLSGGMIMQVIYMDVHVMCMITCAYIIIFYTYNVSLINQIDGLTGLFNQYTYLNALPRVKEGEAIVVMDCDDFKNVNDKYGHVVGDKVLMEIARMIQQEFGKFGKCFRLGGDEFVAILKKDTKFDEVVAKFKKRIELESENLHTNVAVGYEIYNKDEHATRTVDKADKNMYIDKQKNKGIHVE